MHAAWVCALACLGACHRSERGARIYVSNEDDGTVTAIDATSLEVKATLHVGQRPRGLRVSRDGRWLYVALSGSAKGGPGIDESQLPPPDRAADGIGVVDLDDFSLARTLTGGADPESFDLADDDTLVVSNEDTGEASIVDVASGKLRAQIDVGREPEGVATAPDDTVWVTSETDHRVSVIDPAQRKVVATIATGARPRGIAFTPDGRRAFITNENDASVTMADARARTPLARLAMPANAAMPPRPMGIAMAADGAHAYVTTGRAGGIAVIDTARGTVERVIAGVGARPWGIALTPDGRAITANGASNDISVVDLARGQVLRRIHTGSSPWGVAISR